MAAPTPLELRTALKTNLSSIEGVHASEYMLSNITPPWIEIVPDEVDYDLAMQRGADTWMFIVRAYVGAASDQGAQVTLDELLAASGATSVKAAVESDTTLGGKAEDLRVVKATGYRIYGRAGGTEYLGCEWLVEVDAVGK